LQIIEVVKIHKSASRLHL